MATFTSSAYGNPMLVDSQGYIYQRHITTRQSANKIHWRCSKHRRGGCPARATTEGDYVINKAGQHNHLPNVIR